MTREEAIGHLNIIKRILICYIKDENGERVTDTKKARLLIWQSKR